MKSCLRCGKPLGQEIENCPFCRTRTAAGQAAATLETDGGGRKKPIRWVIALLVLLLGGAVTIAFLLNTSPKELFLLSEYQAYKQMKAEFAEKHGEALEFSKKMTEQPSVSHITLQAGMETNSLPYDPDAAMLGELVNSAKIAVKAQQDPQNNKGQYNIALNLEDQDVLDMDLIYTDTQMGIKVPLLYSKFLYMNLSEYGDFMRRIDPSYTGPEKLEFSTVKWQDLELTDKEKNYLRKRYISFLVEQLKEENFTLEKGVEYQFKGEVMKLKKVTLSLTPAETKSLMNRYIDRLIQDKKFHSLIAVRVEKVAKAGAATELKGEVPDQQEIKADIISSLRQEKKKLQGTTFPQGFSSVLLIDKKQRIIDRTMELTVAASDSDKVTWSVHTKNIPFGKDQSLKECIVKAIPKENKKEETTLQLTNHIKGESEERTEDLHVSLRGNGEAVNLKMKSTFDRTLEEKQMINRSFTLVVQGKEAQEWPAEINGKIKQVQEINIDKKYSNEKLNIKFNSGNETDGDMFSFSMNKKSKLVDKVKTVSFSKDLSGSVDVNRMTDVHMAQIQQEVSLNIMSLMSRLGLLGDTHGYPFTDSPQAEDLYEEDPADQEVFNDQASEHSESAL